MNRVVFTLLVIAAVTIATLVLARPAAASCQRIADCTLKPSRVSAAAAIRGSSGVGTSSVSTNATAHISAILRDLMAFFMGPDSIAVGYDDEFLITVRNTGLTAAHDVDLTVAFPEMIAAEAILWTNQGFACTLVTAQTVRCTGGSMGPNNEQGLVRIKARGTAAGEGTVVGTANPNRTLTEVRYDNNVATKHVRVVVLR